MDFRQFLVKSDNIIVSNDLKGTQVIDVSLSATVEDLKNAIRERYKFPKQFEFELWTGPIGMKGKRFDTISDTIDSSIQNVFMKVPIRHRQHTLPVDELEMK